MTTAQRKQRQRAIEGEDRVRRIAVLDMETDPFDNVAQVEVFPFVAALHSDDFPTLVIWEDDREMFVQKVIEAIEALEEPYTIYAHNGGRFDFMFLIHKLRGKVSFKGRGIMAARLGQHELRDSFHIIPEKLASYHKDAFDYSCLTADKRHAHKDVIISYLKNDCIYLLQIVKAFIERFGLKISIGQAAMAALRQHYKTQRLGEQSDAYLRNFFFGGRVECLAGKGHFVGDYNLYDVNSMYPYVMANFSHPIGNEFLVRRGAPGPATCFIVLECHNSGALVKRAEDNSTSATQTSGTFFTTIWEYNVAKKYGLISQIKIKHCVDFSKRAQFDAFVHPLYNERQLVKAAIKTCKDKTTPEYFELKKDDIFLKLLLNNAYGKFAQNPRRFKESYLTNPGECVPEEEGSYGLFPAFENGEYAIWERPAPNMRFNNVATAASITGAARAVLLEAIQLADDPIYCDTDSLICRNLEGLNLHPTLLGAWDIEAEFKEVIICGKKQYACMPRDWTGNKVDLKLKSKGTAPPDWEGYMKMLQGEVLQMIANGPTLTKRGEQYYMKRQIRATAKAKRPAIRRKVA